VIVVIRGGGWRRGDKEGFAFIAGYLARSGFATVCIEYRTSEKATFPAAVHDVKAAVRWVRAHAAKFGFDSDRIGLIGCSAGGQLAALVGASADDQRLEGNGGNSGYSTRVAAVVAMAAVTDFRLTWSKPNGKDGADFLGPALHQDDPRLVLASPVTHVSKEAAPLLLLHSRTDKEVLNEQSTLMKARCEEVGADVRLFTFDDAPHDFWNYSNWFSDSMRHAIQFFHQKFDAVR
jgi:pectinesterase